MIVYQCPVHTPEGCLLPEEKNNRERECVCAKKEGETQEAERTEFALECFKTDAL